MLPEGIDDSVVRKRKVYYAIPKCGEVSDMPSCTFYSLPVLPRKDQKLITA